MRTGWGERELDLPPHPVAEWAGARRERLIEQFPGERLVIPAGGFKVRANDTDYRFRAETAHTYLCGNQTSDAVLVIEDGEAVLYARPNSSRETDEFFRDREYGELWAGRRPTLNEISSSLGVRDAAHRRPVLPPVRIGEDPRPARSRLAAWTPRSPATRVRTPTSPGCSPSCGWSRTSGRSPSCRAPATSPRSGSRTRFASGTGCSSSVSAGSRAPSSAARGRWATTSATTRSSVAAGTRPRCTGSRTPARSRPASCCCSTWARRRPRSTPPT